MKNKLIVILFLSIAMFWISCDQITPTNSNVALYQPHQPNNYWVYERVQIDTNGVETPLGIYDTCFVGSDTLYNGEVYYQYFEPNPYSSIPPYHTYWLHDSADYIITHSHQYFFSSQDFTTEFSTQYAFGPGGNTDTVARIVTQMADQDFLTDVPAGSFLTSNAKKTFYMYPPYQNFGTERYSNLRMAENVGIISQTLPFFLGSGTIVERRLVDYHLY